MNVAINTPRADSFLLVQMKMKNTNRFESKHKLSIAEAFSASIDHK